MTPTTTFNVRLAEAHARLIGLRQFQQLPGRSLAVPPRMRAFVDPVWSRAGEEVGATRYGPGSSAQQRKDRIKWWRGAR